MKVALISGSTRTGSINTKLIHAMAKRYEAADFKATIVNLKDYEMPIYNGDYEAEHGAPKTTLALAKLMLEQDGIFITSPEYNGSLSPLLKNTIDWLTRTGNRDHLHQTVFAIGACTMGPMSGLMVMRQMQYILNRLLCEIVPLQLGVGTAAEAFTNTGELAREFDIKRADQQIETLTLRITARKAVSG